MPRTILNLSQWETRVSDAYSMARACRMTHAAFMEYYAKHVSEELARKHGGKRAVYSAYVHGYVSGLRAAHNAELYRNSLEYCYCVKGVLYSTHKDSTHRLTEEFYKAGKGSELGNHPNGHYWKGSDKPFFMGASDAAKGE